MTTQLNQMETTKRALEEVLRARDIRELGYDPSEDVFVYGEERKIETILTKEAVNSFVKSHENTGSSKRTIIHYRGVLERFATKYPELPLEPEAIEEFISGWEGATRADYFKVLRSFYKFLVKRGKISINPTESIRRPKVQVKLLPSLDREELRRVLTLSPSQISKRDKTIIMLLCGTGLRVGEAINLTFSCIKPDTLIVPKQGKTGEREVPLRAEIRDALLSLKDGHKDTDPVFWSAHHHHPLTNEVAFLYIVRKAFKEAGIEGKRASPHTLRHTFARNWNANGGDLFSLMKILGHKNVATTQVYVYQVTGDLVEKNKKHNPFVGLFDDSLSSNGRSISSQEGSISPKDERLSL